MATLKDIAAEAGVSVMTVSNVINGNHGKVSAKNIQLINELIKKHHYVPNLSARGLIAKSTKIIGVLIPLDFSEYNFFKDPYLSELIGVVEFHIRKLGYYAMIRSVDTAAEITTLTRNWNMDGAIFLLPHYDRIMTNLLTSNHLPMVFLDSYADMPQSVNIGINDLRGGYIATKYLINMGHKKIAFAGPLDNPFGQSVVSQRFEGYKKALFDSGLAFNEKIVYNASPVYDVGITVGREISQNLDNITAVFATSDIMAIGIMEGARTSGLVIPNDLSIVGFDNIESSKYVTPKLTTISQDIGKKAELAIALLIEQIDNGNVAKKKHVLEIELLERQSVLKYTEKR